MAEIKWYFTPEDLKKAISLARELADVWSQWREPFYEGAWEHLGDAERDARVLVRGLLAAQEILQNEARVTPVSHCGLPPHPASRSQAESQN